MHTLKSLTDLEASNAAARQSVAHLPAQTNRDGDVQRVAPAAPAPRHTGPSLPTLSPEALAAVTFPLVVSDGYEIRDATGRFFANIDGTGSDSLDKEWAAFIAAALNEMLTPPVALAPETNLEALQLDTWTAEQIIAREA